MSDTPITQSLADSFRAAIRSAMTEKDPIIREALLSGLELSIEDNEELDTIFQSETSPAQAMALVHIVEPEVENHSANAMSFSKFLKNVVSAVNEVAKQRLNVTRRRPQLLIAGTAPGSLEVTLKAPEDIHAGDLHGEYAEKDIDIPDTAESEALKLVAALFTAASSDQIVEEESPIIAQLAQMPQRARQSISAITRVMQKTQWTLHGEVVQRRQAPLELRFTQLGALRLSSALETIPEKPDHEIIFGYIDGYRRSEGILYIKHHIDDNRAIPISVSDNDLIQRIAEYSIEPSRLYRLNILKYTKLNSMGDVTSTSRSLQEINIDTTQGIQDSII